MVINIGSNKDHDFKLHLVQIPHSVTYLLHEIKLTQPSF